MNLSFPPVSLRPRDDDERAALRSANGADLDGEHATRVVLGAFLGFVLALVGAFVLSGCSSLAAAADGARTARDVARGACALLGAGESDDATAVLAEALKSITEQAAKDAAARGHEAEAVALMRSAAASMGAARVSFEELSRLAGNAPPCPAPAPSAALPPPAASVPVGAAPVSP